MSRSDTLGLPYPLTLLKQAQTQPWWRCGAEEKSCFHGVKPLRAEGMMDAAWNDVGGRAQITFLTSLDMPSVEELISGFFALFSSRSSSSEETSLSLMLLASSSSFLFNSSSSASGSVWDSGAAD